MADGGGTALETASMKELEAQVRTCQLCRLAKTRTKAVPGEGNVRAEVMFIGEGPGYHEDKQGRPFVGAAGQFLNELLALAGLTRESAYIANVVKCRPPNNRDPQPDEIAACAPYLERQIALINPRVIVTLGRYSMAKFFPGEKISQIHGTARLVDGRLCVAMYHPAAGLHQASLADIIRADFRRLPVFLEQAKLLTAPPRGADEERVLEAEAVRESVVHEPETAAILEGDSPPNGHVESAEALAEVAAGAATPHLLAESKAEPFPTAADKAPEEEAAQPSASSRSKQRKGAKKPDDFEQLTMF
jgi:DNA polymerase